MLKVLKSACLRSINWSFIYIRCTYRFVGNPMIKWHHDSGSSLHDCGPLHITINLGLLHQLLEIFLVIEFANVFFYLFKFFWYIKYFLFHQIFVNICYLCWSKTEIFGIVLHWEHFLFLCSFSPESNIIINYLFIPPTSDIANVTWPNTIYTFLCLVHHR